MEKFRVIVGNIGTVYAGNNYMAAMGKFSLYVRASKATTGSAAGESVTLQHNGETKKEYNTAPRVIEWP
jgi:hypothetical protein